MSTPCPTCGTHFAKGEEPWLRPKIHCPKHDFLYVEGTECDHCASEAKLAAAAEEEAANKAADEEAAKKGASKGRQKLEE